MARTKISEFSATPGSNTDIDGINIAEGCAPSGINDAIRELMSQLKDWQAGTSNDPMVIGSTGSLTLNQGTANGVAYLNGSKVLTTGSALTFDGTKVTNGDGAGATSEFRTSTTNAAGAGGFLRGYRNASPSYLLGDLAPITGGAGGGLVAYVYGANPFSVYTNGNERLQVDSSGNLGLGVTPSAWLSGAKAIQIGAGGYVDSRGAVNLDIGSNAYIDSGTTWRYISTGAAAQARMDSGTFSWLIAPSGTAGNAISFTQAMTLDASGRVQIGTTSPIYSASLSIKSASNSYTITSSRVGGGTGTLGHIVFENDNGAVGTIQTTGSTTAYNTSSDYRLKNITGPITNSGAYIDSLNPVEGTWKADGSTFVGLIAHEVQEASRTPVATGVKDGEEMQGMDYSSSEIIANMIAELKSLRARVAQLEVNKATHP